MISSRWRTALFLCFIIALDEFCVKTEYVTSTNEIVQRRNSLTPDQIIRNDDLNDLDYYQSLDNATSDVSKRTEKRGVIVAILVGASIAASLANLGFDIYLHIKGCCGIYKETCDYRDEFNSLKKVLTRKSKDVDNIYTEAENVKQWLSKCNFGNREIWLELNRIANVEQELIEALTPDVVVGFQNTSTELKIRIRQKNATVLGMSDGELAVTFESVFSSAKSTLLAISGVVGSLGSLLIGKAMNTYKLNKMANFLKTSEGSRLVNAQPKAQKLLGASKTNINSHYKATARAQYKANYKPIKAKIAGGAAAVFALITIGLEIYSAVMKVKACQKIRDNARDAVVNLRNANSDMDKTLVDVNKYRNDVNTEGWNKIRQELVSQDVADVLSEVRTLASGASSKSQAMVEAVAAIDEFTNNIKNANHEQTYNLQQRLIKGLSGLEYTLECYTNMVKGTSYMLNHCKNGDGQFDDLWNRVVSYFYLNSNDCVNKAGVPFITKEKMLDVIKIQAANRSFNSDCILNNKDIKHLTCSLKHRGHDAAYIATDLKLSIDQVNILLPNCPPKPVTTTSAQLVCRLYKRGVDIFDIIVVTEMDYKDVISIIRNQC